MTYMCVDGDVKPYSLSLNLLCRPYNSVGYAMPCNTVIHTLLPR